MLMDLFLVKEMVVKFIFSPNSMLSHWLLRGHMTSKNKTFSRQKSVSEQRCKSMTSKGQGMSMHTDCEMI